jgi:hypothetical protein
MEQSPKIGETKPAAPHENATQTENDKIEAIAERVVAALTKINRSNRKADAAENERNHRREQRRFKVELIEIFLIAVYAIVTIFEWRTFNSERQTMEMEYITSQASAEHQLFALQGQLDEMKRTPELDERAWIFTDLPDNSLVWQSNICTVTVRLKNTGKTPAINVGSVEAAVTNRSQIPNFEPKVEGLKYALSPNGADFLPYPLPTQTALQLQHGKKVYLYGTIFYSDIFGREHWTQFCYSLIYQGVYVNMTPPFFHNSCDTETETNKTN